MDAKVTSISHGNSKLLSERLQSIHAALLYREPDIANISCLFYNVDSDLLISCVHSTIDGKSHHSCQVRLAESPYLHNLVTTKSSAVIDALDSTDVLGHQHAGWSREQGFKSAFVVPLFSDEAFLGFLFYEALTRDVFTDPIQRDLQLHSQLMAMTIASELSLLQMLMATANVARDFADLRDFETGLHLDRMAIYARMIATNLMESHGLSPLFVEHLHIYARLHDIGKIGIPDQILMKNEHLSAEERRIIESHVEKGVTILNQVLEQYKLRHLPDSEMMLNIVAFHHEYLDGSGYPNHLKGKDIPLEARIVTVADIFDALTSRRPYKRIWSVADALNELERMQQLNKLDADCVMALKVHATELETIVVELADDGQLKEA